MSLKIDSAIFLLTLAGRLENNVLPRFGARQTTKGDGLPHLYLG